jgi:hypothetical protein
MLCQKYRVNRLSSEDIEAFFNKLSNKDLFYLFLMNK